MVKQNGANVVLNFHDGKIELDRKTATDLVSSLRRAESASDVMFKRNQVELRRFSSYFELTFLIQEADALVAKIYTLDLSQAEYLAAGISRAIPSH
ncbi:MAG: hypothetical protein K2Z81_07020 [Cyanobacteria bacterium]|nr:hypothetical protein [Cyanobacteriota bacterium]